MSRPRQAYISCFSITTAREDTGGSHPPPADVTCPLQLADVFAELFLTYIFLSSRSCLIVGRAIRQGRILFVENFAGNDVLGLHSTDPPDVVILRV
jgi:hypothetical protein